MDTSRVDGVKAPQHRGTPRSRLPREVHGVHVRDELQSASGGGLLARRVRPQGLVEELRAEVGAANADREDRREFFARRADPLT